MNLLQTVSSHAPHHSYPTGGQQPVATGQPVLVPPNRFPSPELVGERRLQLSVSAGTTSLVMVFQDGEGQIRLQKKWWL